MYFDCMVNDDIGLRFDISTLKIDKGDTIILTFDTELWDIDQIQKIMEYISNQFYDNKVIAKVNGIEIGVK